MKNDGTYFDFIIYMAFQALSVHSDKKELSIKQIHDYRLNVIRQLEEYFSQFDSFDDEEYEEKLYDFFTKNKEITESEEIKKIKEFINYNSNFFYLEGNKLCMLNNVTYKDLNDRKFKLDCYSNNIDRFICGYALHHLDDLDGLSILDAMDIANDVEKLYKVEKELEQAYEDYEDNDSKTKIGLCNSLVYMKLLNIYKHDHDYINTYFRNVINMKSKNNDLVEINLLSDELKENDKFYENNSYVNSYLQEMFYQAIFANNSLVYEKLLLYLEILETYKRPSFDGPVFEPLDGDWDSFLANFQCDTEYYEDEYDDENKYDDFLESDLDEEDDDIKELNNKYHIDYVFFINYLNNLITYQNKHDKANLFNDEIKRLSYLLNRFNRPLYYDEIDKLVESVTSEDIDYRNDMYDFYVTSRLFIFDLLYNEIVDDKSLKKILYVITYYDLTNDKRIKKIVNKYKNKGIGTNIYNAVINHVGIDFFEKENKQLSDNKKLLKKRKNTKQ